MLTKKLFVLVGAVAFIIIIDTIFFPHLELCLYCSKTPPPSRFPPDFLRNCTPSGVDPDYTTSLIHQTKLLNNAFNLTHNLGWNRTKTLLRICRERGATLFLADTGQWGTLFVEVMNFTAGLLRNYGCADVRFRKGWYHQLPEEDKEVERRRLIVSLMLGTDHAHLPDYPLLLQTEILAGGNDFLRKKPYWITPCMAHPYCVFWDYYPQNIVDILKQFPPEKNGTCPSVLMNSPIQRPKFVQSSPLKRREKDYIFYGLMTPRRKKIVGRLGYSKARKEWKYQGTTDAKICLCLHADGREGFEWHRLSEQVGKGCVLVYEEPVSYGDFWENVKQTGAIYLFKEKNLGSEMERVLGCIKRFPEEMQMLLDGGERWWERELDLWNKNALKEMFGELS